MRREHWSAQGAILVMIGLGLTVLLGAARPRSATAEEAPPPQPGRELTKDERLSQLSILRAQLTVRQARNELQRAKTQLDETTRLFDEKVVTIDKLNKAQQERDQAELKLDEAEIELEKTQLELLKDAIFVTVVDAKKYRGPESQVMASVRLRNDSDIGKARVIMGDDEGTSEDTLRGRLKIDNVVVTLRGADGSIVGDPFQQTVPGLKHGEEATLDFVLLKRDVDDVTISIEFLGTEKNYTVFLKKEAQEDLPTLVASPYDQRGQLGTKVTYRLDMERLAKTEQSFSMVVLNLPAEIPVAFLDPGSKAQIMQVRFTGEVSKQALDLEIAIPEKLDASFIDKSISFTVLVTRQSELKQVSELSRRYEGKLVPAEEIAKLKGDKADLILTPKGVGKLEIVVANLFKEVQQDEPISFRFTIVNSGTLALRRVTPEVDPPLEWETTVTPKDVEVIEPGDKPVVTVDLAPPRGVAVGEYTMKLKTKGHSGVETVEAREKDFTVRIAAKSNITGTVVLVAVLIVLVIGIAVASIRISRR